MSTAAPPDYPFRLPDRFYGLHPLLGIGLAMGSMLLAGAILLPLTSLGYMVSPLYFLVLLLLLPILNLFLTPPMRVFGVYRYYSALFLTFGETSDRIEIHSGPGLDYLLHLRGLKPGEQIKRTVLGFYLQGLLNIAAKVETLPDPAAVTITGTSWFFSERSVARMGFTVSEGGLFHRINLIFNLAELAILNSLSAGRFAWPNVLRAKQATMTGQDLLDHRGYIRRLYERLATERNREFETYTFRRSQ